MTTLVNAMLYLTKSLAAALICASVSASAWGATQCAPGMQAGVERCVSGLSASALGQIRQAQQASSWCWAASISMVFRSYGTEVPQEQIVKAQFGAPVNSGVSARAILGLLNRSWRDEGGRTVTSSAGPLPTWRRHLGLGAPEVIADLERGRPLLVGSQQHAMVLVQVVYERHTDGSVRMVRAVVLDPASDVGVRSLREDRDTLDFVARIEVHASSAERLVAEGSAQAAPADVF